MSRRRYLASYRLPSGNSCNVYLVSAERVDCEWDDPPSPAWPAEDVLYYEQHVFPAILRCIATKTNQRVLGVLM